MFEGIKSTYSGFRNNLGFIADFFANEDITRLRVFIIWSLGAMIPSLFIAWTINNWQIHVPGVEVGTNQPNTIVPMLVGSSILPILFTFTKGLRGYHSSFNKVIEGIFSKFKKKSTDELEKEFSEEVAALKINKVNRAFYFSAFLSLELLIVGWDLALYPFLGAMSGLGLFGYISDNLLLGAYVLILEGIYTIFDGLVEAPDVYELKVEVPDIKGMVPSVFMTATVEELKETDQLEVDLWDEDEG